MTKKIVFEDESYRVSMMTDFRRKTTKEAEGKSEVVKGDTYTKHGIVSFNGFFYRSHMSVKYYFIYDGVEHSRVYYRYLSDRTIARFAHKFAREIVEGK